MKAVVQRVAGSRLTVDGELISEIGRGLTVFLGVGQGDVCAQADKLAAKIANLRIFEDGGGKMNLSVKDTGGEILLVSQFTLYGDCSHGNRPSFSNAMEPVEAKKLYLYCGKKLEECGVPVKYGVFGADMKIAQLNDGPVSIIIDI